MNHKGQKSELSVRMEEVFMSVMTALGLQVFYEYPLYGNKNRIDFVAGSKVPNKPGYMYTCGATGVELKTSTSDIASCYGRNYDSFPFSYLLVPEKILYYAVKKLDEIGKEYVGIITLDDDTCVPKVIRPARFHNALDKDFFDKSIDNPSVFTKYEDVVGKTLYKASLNDEYETHNFKTHKTRTVRRRTA